MVPEVSKVVFTARENLLLSEDLEKSEDGCFSETALQDCERILKSMAGKARHLGAEQMAGAATAAFRKAKNGPAFVKRVRDEMGVMIKIVSQVCLLPNLISPCQNVGSSWSARPQQPGAWRPRHGRRGESGRHLFTSPSPGDESKPCDT